MIIEKWALKMTEGSFREIKRQPEIKKNTPKIFNDGYSDSTILF